MTQPLELSEYARLILPVDAQMFRNRHFVKRDYEATNVVACLAASAPDENWIPTTHEELNAMLRSPLQALEITAGVHYYGYL
jgi:hypothetical protein